MILPAPTDEAKRLAVLAECGVLDTPVEAQFNDIAALAARLCDTPIAAISLVDANRTWYKAIFGLSLSESPRDTAPCSFAMLEPRGFWKSKTPAVIPGSIISTWGSGSTPECRLLPHDNFALGALCVLDTVPRRIDPEQKRALATLAEAATGLIELRRASSRLGADES